MTMSDSMTKFKNRMSAEESVSNFIAYLEESGTKLSSKNREWLYSKGQEIFDTYYVDETINVNLATEYDKEKLLDYFNKVQDTLGKMFAHIILIEFKLYLLTGE